MRDSPGPLLARATLLTYDAWAMFAKLKVIKVQRHGALLEGSVFLPMGAQTQILSPGEEIIVFVEQLNASMRLEEHIDEDTSSLRPQQKVALLIVAETSLGYQAIINGRHIGVLYRSEVFQPLEHGDQLSGYVKKVREDGKVDLILQPLGIQGRGDLGRQILDKLEQNGGFLALHDRTTPEAIYAMFGVSKKKYKMALGGLYKQQLVSIEDEGIRLKP